VVGKTVGDKGQQNTDEIEGLGLKGNKNGSGEG
jgi:hypothetical protein